MLLHFTELNNPFPHTFLDLLFGTCSAAATVVVATGMTSCLSFGGQLELIVCMYLGRLSPVTVLFALNSKPNPGADSLKFPEERVIIGLQKRKMNTKKKYTHFAVFGLGRSGMSIIQTLSEDDVHILACDRDEAELQYTTE